MPRPVLVKKADKVELTDPQKGNYDGFLEDVEALVKWCNDSKLEDEIADIENELNARVEELENNARTDKEKEALDAYKAMVGQLTKIKSFISRFTYSQSQDKSYLNVLMHWNTHKNWGDRQQSYAHNMQWLIDFVVEPKQFFTDPNGKSVDIRSNLDKYNLLNDYNDFAKDDSVLIKVDNIFSKVERLYAEVTRMETLRRKYLKECELADRLYAEKKNLELYGKKCYDEEDFSIAKYNKKVEKAKKALKESELEAGEAPGKAKEAEEKLAVLEKEYRKQSKPEKYLKEEEQFSKQYAEEKDEKKKAEIKSQLDAKRKQLTVYFFSAKGPTEEEKKAYREKLASITTEYEKAKKDAKRLVDNVAASAEQRDKDKLALEEAENAREAQTGEFYVNYLEAIKYENDVEYKEENKKIIQCDSYIDDLKISFSNYMNRINIAKESGHKDTDEFKAMKNGITALLALKGGKDSVREYLTKVEEIKSAAEFYITKKNSQRFHWIPSKMRKFRLQFAKGLVELCEQQLASIDPDEVKETTELAQDYLQGNRKDTDHKYKEDYEAYLDSKKEAAVNAYLSSSEYHNKKAALEDKHKDELLVAEIVGRKSELKREHEKEMKEFADKEKNVKHAANPIKQHRRQKNMLADPNMDQILQNINQPEEIKQPEIKNTDLKLQDPLQ